MINYFVNKNILKVSCSTELTEAEEAEFIKIIKPIVLDGDFPKGLLTTPNIAAVYKSVTLYLQIFHHLNQQVLQTRIRETNLPERAGETNKYKELSKLLRNYPGMVLTLVASSLNINADLKCTESTPSNKKVMLAMILIHIAKNPELEVDVLGTKLATDLNNSPEPEGLLSVFKINKNDLVKEINLMQHTLDTFIEIQKKRFEVFAEGFTNYKALIKKSVVGFKDTVSLKDIQEKLITYFQERRQRDAFNRKLKSQSSKIEITDSEIRIFIAYNEDFRLQIEKIIEKRAKNPKQNTKTRPIILLTMLICGALYLVIYLIIVLLNGKNENIQNSKTKKPSFLYIKLFSKTKHIMTVLVALAVTALSTYIYNKKNRIFAPQKRGFMSILSSFINVNFQ